MNNVLRYIAILVFETIFVIQSTGIVWAISETENIVHSIEELQVQSNLQVWSIFDEDITDKRFHTMEDISALIASNIEYTEQTVFTSSNAFSDENMFDNFVDSQNQVLITWEKAKKIRVGQQAKKKKNIVWARGSIQVDIHGWTIISTPSWETIDPTQIDILSPTTNISLLASEYHSKKIKKSKKWTPESILNSDVFEFWIPGKHLIFSTPVALSLVTPGYSDGVIVDIATLHEGDAGFNTKGLSVNPTTQCTSDGLATRPWSQGIVKWGKVTFYTCWASSFTINPVGGVVGSNDLKLVIGDYGQIQVYYNGLAQIYGWPPPNTGGGTPSVWPRLRIGTRNIGNGGTAWTSTSTTGSQVGNNYTAKNTLTYTRAWRTYVLVIDWSYTAPNKFFTWKYTLTVPSNNAENVRFYYGMDSYVAGSDTNDVGYYTTTPSQTVGVYDSVANVLSAQRYVSGQTWAWYYVGNYTTVQNQTNGWANYINQIQASTDLGYGINWNFWTTPGTYTSTTEWRILPYVSASVPDLIPGIGQPDPTLAVGVTSQIPITLTNAGQASSSGTHTIVFTLPTGMAGPTAPTSSYGWNCGAQVGVTVTCAKITTIAPLGYETLNIPIIPAPGTQWTFKTFSVTNSGWWDSNTTNNSASVTLQIAIAPTPMDTVLPNITSISLLSWSLLPIGNFPISVSYSDTGTNINTSSFSKKIYSWNTGSLSWSTTDIAPTYTSIIGSPTTDGAAFQVSNLPMGKYRFDISIADNIGNVRMQSYTYYIDAIQWNISSDQYDIGWIPTNTQTFGTGEMIITVKTVWAGFNIQMVSTNTLVKWWDAIWYWDGLRGWWYDMWNGTTYSNTISDPSTSILIANQWASINPNGLLNTYTYRIKFGGKVGTEQVAGLYDGSIKFDISVNY